MCSGRVGSNRDAGSREVTAANELVSDVYSCRDVCDRILNLRIATPQTVKNYAMFLQKHDYFEYAFKAYERRVAVFKWPQVFDIWDLYLAKLVKGRGGKQMERARYLFEHCLETCPAKFTKSRDLILQYAQMERALGKIDRARAISAHASEICDPKVCAVFYFEVSS
ncbi:hypothetical protein Y032_0029g2001 [Ancylostoma ceylanicum]|uniref:Pre-mRNA-splicing factor Syf1/CRNKL1-like C-terminal HAT-repeats domain-containing protein n=1 Tax=Ancylostoma ceylanicum TaxID=53326 RepID=A0A016UU79_9BILA|nr:hypothetical protein Y032_0029g2001 [Ancylostoma ceylanicum]